MSGLLRPAPKPTPRQPRARRPIRKVNPERKARRYEEAFGAKGDWIRRQRCCLTGRFTGDRVKDSRVGMVTVVVVAAHATSRGARGTSKDLIPLAQHLHDWAHGPGGSHPALGRRFGQDLKELAKWYEKQWQSIRPREEGE